MAAKTLAQANTTIASHEAAIKDLAQKLAAQGNRADRWRFATIVVLSLLAWKTLRS